MSICVAGVKSEIKSPGLTEAEASTLSQDPSSFYGATVDISSVYDKEYSQAYPSAHQYYNRYSRFFFIVTLYVYGGREGIILRQ